MTVFVLASAIALVTQLGAWPAPSQALAFAFAAQRPTQALAPWCQTQVCTAIAAHLNQAGTIDGLDTRQAP